MKAKSISIIGCGWVGLPLAQSLLQDGYWVRGSTTRSDKLELLRSRGIEAYLYPASPPEPALLGSDILVLTFPPERGQEDSTAHYLSRMKHLAEGAPELPREGLLFLSSTGVYGDPNGIVTEEDTPRPSRKTARALWAAEEWWRERAGDRLTVLRLAGLAGPGREPGRFLAGRKDLPGGNAPVNLVWREDVVRACRDLIRQQAWGDTLNVCADQHPLKKDYYPARARLLGLEPPAFDPKKSTDYKIVSNDRIKRRLAFSFRYPDPVTFPRA